MTTIYLLLGTNLGNRVDLLRQARDQITQDIAEITNASTIYETASWGDSNQPNYLNQVVQADTPIPPQLLLEKVNTIEKHLGRERQTKWAPRPMDIDILLYGNAVINEPGLVVPHPLLPGRRFALIPLLEIAPSLLHPVAKKTIAELLDETTDQLSVQPFNVNTYESFEF